MIKRNRLLLYGVTQSGEKVFLGVPRRFILKKDIGASSIMTAVIKMDERKDRFIKVSAVCDGTEIFSGCPDEEVYTVSGMGVYLEISARCNISLLIDNEVMPQLIRSPSLSFFSRKFLEPYGFKIKSKGKTGSGELKAGKNTSVLSFLNTFFKKVYDTKPVIKDDGSVYLLSEYTPDFIFIEDNKLIKIEITKKTCDIISEYILPDSVTGAYNTSFKNENASGIQRRKYKENPGEMDFSVYNDIKLTLEGFAFMDICDEIECFDEKGIIESIRYERTNEGDRTTVLFKSMEV